jgi:hypothetical protein
MVYRVGVSRSRWGVEYIPVVRIVRCKDVRVGRQPQDRVARYVNDEIGKGMQLDARESVLPIGLTIEDLHAVDITDRQ